MDIQREEIYLRGGPGNGKFITVFDGIETCLFPFNGEWIQYKRERRDSNVFLIAEVAEVAEVAKVSVPDRLAKLGDIYRERNAVYGDTYRNFGKVMIGFFPGGITLNTEQEWNRVALFFHCADKLARTAAQLPGGVHVDSLDDNSVYSQMLQEYDADVKAR